MLLSVLLATLMGAPAQTAPGGLKGQEPQVASSGSRVYLTVGDGGRVCVMASGDGGLSFGAPVRLPSTGRLSVGMRRGPRIAVSGRFLVVSAIFGQKGGGQDGELIAWRSEDGGKSWSAPVPVSDVPGAAREGLHAMAASSSGSLACAWLDLRGKGTEVWTSVSEDGGKSWSKNALAYRSPSGTVCECCHPSVAFGPKGELHVMFRNWLGGARDMYLCTSRDGGGAFDPARKLGNGSWPLNACPMDGGALAVRSDGTIVTAWRRGNSVFLCEPGKPERELGKGTQPWVATDGTKTFAVWLGSDDRVRSLSGESFTSGVSPVVGWIGNRGIALWGDRSGRVSTRPLR